LHGYRLKPALGGAAQRRDPLGEQIAEFFGGLCDLVEEFMEGDKVRPLTFQCACVACRSRSMADARLRLSKPTDRKRIDRGRVFLVSV